MRHGEIQASPVVWLRLAKYSEGFVRSENARKRAQKKRKRKLDLRMFGE